MDKECLDCGSPLRGRTDKKFCDDQCRSNYNNRMKAGSLSSIRPVNAILRRNYVVLSKLCPGKKIKLKKDELLCCGFDLSYHTHLYNTQSGDTFYGCYDYGFMKLEEDVILIVKNKVHRFSDINSLRNS